MTIDEPDEHAELVENLSAALRADTADVEAYHRVLASTIGDLLPEGMVEVERERSFSDRVSGREGAAKAIRVRLGEKTIELTSGRRGLSASVATEVRGVVISRREISVAEWTVELAIYLTAVAKESSEARSALDRFLRP